MMTMCSIITVSYYNYLDLFILCNFCNFFHLSYIYTAGPTVEPTMRVSILSSRDTDPNVVFTMSFNVTFGPPSRVYCVYIRKGQTVKTFFFDERDDIIYLAIT